jgi:VWFA-related protein
MVHRAVAAAAFALLLQTPQFRSGIDVVHFDVLALDKARQPIAGLTAADFHVTENGQPLRIAGFEAVTIPASAPPAFAPAPSTFDPHADIVTNRRDEPGRLVVIMMDRTIPYETPAVTARKIANAAIDALGPNDLAAVVFTSGIAGPQPQGFTTDRARLRAAVATMQMGTPTLLDMTPGGLRRVGPSLPQGECWCGLCAMEKLALVADALASVDNYRKMILFIGDDLPIAEDSAAGRSLECRGLFGDARDRLFETVERANVTVHSFNPRGLDTGAVGADAFRSDPREPSSERLIREGDLKTLPELTGGRTIVNVNFPEQFVPAVFDESRTYYVLAVERAPARKDRRPHMVKIEVARPDVSVVSRTTYLDPPPVGAKKATPAPADPLEGALEELLPRTDLPLRMTLKATGTRGSSLDVTLATPRPSSARADVLVGVFDQFAKRVGSEHGRVQVPAAGDGRDTEWNMHLNPKPGRYEVRAAVRIGDAIGSVTGYVEVPKRSGRTDAPPSSDAPPSAGPAAAFALPAPRSAALDAVLERAGGYVEQYGDPGGGLLLDESYRQDVQSSPYGVRNLTAQLLILPDETQGWVQFRDVLSVDGKKVADREDRVARLFSTPSPDRRGQARRIAEESARYNLTSGRVAVTRSLNQPLAVLLYLRPVNQPRSRFTLEEKTRDGQHLTFTEQRQPTLIGATGDAGATGEFWIDQTTGQIRRAFLRIVSRASNVTVTATIRVEYQADAKTGLALPVTMTERYEARDPRGNLVDIISGDARYSNPRRFAVTVDRVD